MKDPAFLFYTKDFQSGTQDMSCEEVGAYIRLLMYQHQHNFIPDNKERMMRITGIFSEEKFDSVWEMIDIKFEKMANHLVNQRLNQEMNQRQENKPKKIASATLAGLISSRKLAKKQVFEIKKNFKTENFIYGKGNSIKELEDIKADVKEWFLEMVNQMVNNKGNADANANANNNIKKVQEFLKPISPEWREVISDWLFYKIDKKQEYASSKSVVKFESQLKNFSGNNIEMAKAIIDKSIANNWDGIYKPKEDAKREKPNSVINAGSFNANEDF